MPAWLPLHLELVYVSGFFEILFGLLLLFAVAKRFAAFGIIIMLIAIFPANIQIAVNYASDNNKWLWIALLRLPLQIVLILWAYRFTKQAKKKLYL